MKIEIMYLQQKKRPIYPIPPGNYRHFRTTDGLVICRRCNCVGHFTHAWKANLPPMKVPPRYQNHKFSYLPTTHRNIHSLCISQINNSQRAPYKTNNKKHDTMRYLYSQDAIYTNPSWKLLFPSAGKTDNKYKPEGLISQVSTRMKVTWFKTMLYWTGSASYKAT